MAAKATGIADQSLAWDGRAFSARSGLIVAFVNSIRARIAAGPVFYCQAQKDIHMLKLVQAVVITAFVLAPVSSAFAACSDAAAPKVDWSLCDKKGKNLQGLNLQGANLMGAGLQGTFLSMTNLKGANLGGANLKGAHISGADLKGAKLFGAIWTDGRACRSGSVGKCK